MPDILVIDDEENIAFSIRLALQRAGHECRVAHTAADGLALCREKLPDVALVDVQLPDANGLDLIEQVRQLGAEVPIIVITAFGSVARAVEAMKRGASDFLQKPLSMEEVRLAVDRCLENRRLRDRLDAYAHAQRRISDTVELVGECPAIRQMLALADRIAALPADPASGLVSTLILGETGTGKEVLARYIHQRGPRADRPFVHVNCSAIPETLFESELMGHERGTFTDAREPKKGLLEIAHEGTIFLDEIGDMPPALQAKLLVVIEGGRFRRLGGTRERAVDVRVIAASNADVAERVHGGGFRADLYYRLKSFELVVPPLRRRGDDLFLLADYFLDLSRRKLRKPVPELPEDTRAVMRRYAWPGNVRELAHVIQRAVLLADDGRITPHHLGLDETDTAVGLEAAGGAGAAAGAVSATGRGFDFSREDCNLSAMERRLIVAAIEHAGGNISEAARLLGVTRGGLRHRMQKQGITPPKRTA